MIVADTSLIASFFLETEFTPQAISIHKKMPIWIFPPIWKEEYANVLAKFARRDRTMTEEKIIAHLDYTLSELEKYERKVNLSTVLQLAFRRKISVYDAHFVQLSIEYDVVLVTEDREIIKKCPDKAMSMKNYLEK